MDRRYLDQEQVILQEALPLIHCYITATKKLEVTIQRVKSLTSDGCLTRLQGFLLNQP